MPSSLVRHLRNNERTHTVRRRISTDPAQGTVCLCCFRSQRRTLRTIAIRPDALARARKTTQTRRSEMKSKTMTEDAFLSARVSDRRPVHCWLANGIKLHGVILGFDPDTLYLKAHGAVDDSDAMMIFKMQVASIAPIPDDLHRGFPGRSR